jgi:amino acid adenylation domain-containing protein
MKRIEDLLSKVRKAGITLDTDGEKLRIFAPEGALTADLRRELTECKPEVIASLREIRGLGQEAQVIQPVSRDQPLRLSFAQQRIWFLEQLGGAGSTYNSAANLKIEGPLDVKALEGALSEISRRHEILRSRFIVVAGVPVQRVQVPNPIHAGYTDLSDLSLERREEEIKLRLHRALHDPFDLTNDAPFRVSLLRLEPECHLLLLTMHHLASDGWSMGVFGNELAVLYHAFKRQEPSPLPELLIQFADFAAWQQQRINGAFLDGLLDYWIRQLDGAATLLGLPLDFPRSPASSFRGGKVLFTVGREVTGRLQALSRQTGTTLFMVLHAAFVTLLSRYSNQEDICVGVPIANRPHSTLESLIGCFVNTLVLRTDLGGNPTFQGFLLRVRQVATEAYAHQDMPFERLIDELKPDRNLTYHPLFQVMFIYQNLPMGFPEWPGLSLLPREEDAFTPGAIFDLTLVMAEQGGVLEGAMEFNANLFGRQTIKGLVRNFEALLEEIAEDPDRRLADFACLASEEQECVIQARNQTGTSYPKDRTVIDLFDEIVETHPDWIAAVFEDAEFTYAELKERATLLAQELTMHGVAVGDFVALLVERSIEMVIGLLGILKSGAAYLPIDLAYPESRIEHVLENSAVNCIVTRKEIGRTRKFIESFRGKVVFIDRVPTSPTAAQVTLPKVQPSAPAYAIYTSGSSGLPKGVVIEHQSLLNYVWWARNEYVGDARFAFPVFTSLSFDLTVTSIYVPLISGGKIVLFAEDGTGRDPAIFRILRENRVDVMKLTPSHLALLRDVPVTGSRLKRVILGGEDLKVDLACRFREALGGQIDICNEYGPTEATVGCMIHHFDPVIDNSVSVPIGVPSANVQLYLLNRHLRPVPAGVVGEIYISGDGLARGYLNRPDLTAERFLPNPFSAGRRMYRTGDLGRWRADGVMEYAGRDDQQIKVRGVRIELGEIEHQLAAHDAIAQCAILAIPRTEFASKPARSCTNCGLGADYPGVVFDGDGVCNFCREWQQCQENTRGYFKTLTDFRALFDAAAPQKKSPYDCIVLFSGGKDSTYLLYQVVEMGLKVLAWSLDNGYISEEAKANIRKVVKDLGVDHIFGTTPAMDAIFADSLRRYSNVCNGCFKTIYTLSMNLAKQRGIKYIVTGLSRGQLFETRLSGYYASLDFDPVTVDRDVLAARKVYHRLDDVVARQLEVSIFRDDLIFQEIHIVDFYRYCDVSLGEMLRFLKERAPWIRPADTGRSTNCRINDVGIYVHKRERGFHNYALPYSWDVRLGHKDRTAAAEELNDNIDTDHVNRILNKIGYSIKTGIPLDAEKFLVAYYVPKRAVPEADLRAYLSARVPDEMIPRFFMPLEEMPLTPNGKIDHKALVRPEFKRPELEASFAAPQDETEKRLAAIWGEVLGFSDIGIHDNFFKLGGHSLLTTQVISRISRDFQIDMAVRELFEHATIAEIAAVIKARLAAAREDALAAALAEVEGLTDEEVSHELLPER